MPADAELTVEELSGGVSGTVLAVHGPGIALVVKQALPRLRVTEEWNAPARRTDTEAAALRLAAQAHPRLRPPVVDSDSREHIVVLQHAPSGWRNWQAELLDGRAHAASGAWAGDTLGRLHTATAGDAEVAAAFADYEAFAQLRLEPYHGAVIERLPHLAAALAPLVEELRDSRVCLVHGDYAPKNVLLGRDGAWILDAEVAHVGNPVFDLAFFIAYPLLTAVQKPRLAGAVQRARRRIHSRLRAPGAPADAAAERDHRPHGGHGARPHRRPLARGLPRCPRGQARAQARRASPARPGAGSGGGRGVMRVSERAIERVLGFEALDSRGTPTVACVVTLSGGAQACAIVPSGASTGRHEAHERRDGGERYAGRGAANAVAAVNGEIAAKLHGHDAAEQDVVDAALRDLDGTPSLARLGANAVLAASVACALAAAEAARTPLWRLLDPESAPAAAAADGERPLGRRPRRARGRRAGRARDPGRGRDVRRGDRACGARARRRRRGAARARLRDGARGRRGRAGGAARLQRGGTRGRDARRSSAPASTPRWRSTSPRRSWATATATGSSARIAISTAPRW